MVLSSFVVVMDELTVTVVPDRINHLSEVESDITLEVTMLVEYLVEVAVIVETKE